jgi:hypothetical protein
MKPLNNNRQAILQDWVKQSLTETTLGFSRSRIKVGSQGGLAYRLFLSQTTELLRLDLSHHPTTFDIKSLYEFSLVQDYFKALQTYIDTGEEFAKRYNFGLVTVTLNGKDAEISDGFKSIEEITRAGLGSVDIKDEDRFKGFFQMITSLKADYPIVNAEKAVYRQLVKLHEEQIVYCR